MGTPPGLDWTWATATGGALSPPQHRRLLPTYLHDRNAHPVRRRPAHRGTARLNLDQTELPDTKLTRNAEIEAHERLSRHLIEHAYRTYYLGLLLAEIDGVDHDNELAFTSCLLHDLTLEHATTGRCFAVTSAERAIEWALGIGITPRRARELGAAISGHITPGAAANLAEPSGFLAAGVEADIFGTRLHEIDPDFLHDLLRRHPRYDLKTHLKAAMTAEATAMPHGRVTWLLHHGAARMIDDAPFSE
ncbi:phosphohydrolase [Nocardia takedensis]|uniref:phosphohydrolase n=1 Tax=Nocardia takedensis TaxID=259390 RepID=UPI003F773D3D